MSTSVTGVSNHFPSAENGFTSTLASTISSGATTVPLNSVAGYSNGEVAVFVVDPTDAAKKQTFTGIIDTAGVQVTSVVWTAGTNQTHSGGATVVDYVTATHISMMTKGILVEHGQPGVHTSPLITSRTEDTSPATGDFLLSSDVSDGNALKKVQLGNVTPYKSDKSVLTTDSNPYKFSAYCSTGKTVTNTTLIVDFQTELFDTNNNFASSRYTAPVAGFYQISTQAWVASAGLGTTETAEIKIRKNNSTDLAVSQRDNGSGDANKLVRPQIHRLIQLAASDYIEVYVTVVGSRDLVAGEVYTYITGFLMSRT